MRSSEGAHGVGGRTRMVRPDPSLQPLRVVACADKSREKAGGTAGLEGTQVALDGMEEALQK